MTSLDSVNSSNENRIDESTWTRTWINNNDIFTIQREFGAFSSISKNDDFTQKRSIFLDRCLAWCDVLSARYSTTKFHPLCSHSAVIPYVFYFVSMWESDTSFGIVRHTVAQCYDMDNEHEHDQTDEHSIWPEVHMRNVINYLIVQIWLR